MSEDYTRRTLPAKWNVLIDKTDMQTDVNVLEHCSSLCVNNFNSASIDDKEQHCFKKCFNKSLSFLDYFKAEAEDLYIHKAKEFFNREK